MRATARPAWRTCSSTWCSRGRPSTSQHPARADRARLASERLHLVRSHELLRDVPGHRRESRLGARPRVRSHGELFIAKTDLDSEMTVVRNEFECGENSPTSILLERMLSTAYLWHNYGKSTIGSRSDIENVPIDRLQAFYRNYYQPDNAVLLVAGKFDEPKTLALIDQYFGAIPHSQRATIPSFYTQEPTQDGERAVTIRRVGDVQWVMSAYHVPSGAAPRFRCSRSARPHVLGDTPAGPAPQRAGGNETGQPGIRWRHFQLHDPGTRTLQRAGPAGSIARYGARRPPEDRRSDRCHSTDRRRTGARDGRTSDADRAAAEFLAIASACNSASGSAWAIGGCSSSTATASGR